MNDREKLIDLLERVPHLSRLYPDSYADYLLANGVTFEAEPVRYAEWVWADLYDEGYSILHCSNCKESKGAREGAQYCSNCGAKMTNKK